jgi:hypothetical protein
MAGICWKQAEANLANVEYLFVTKLVLMFWTVHLVVHPDNQNNKQQQHK